MQICLQNRFHNGTSFVHSPLTVFTFGTWVLSSGNDSSLEVILVRVCLSWWKYNEVGKIWRFVFLLSMLGFV